MADLTSTRRHIVVAIAIMGIIDAVALVYLLLPLRAGAAQPAQVQRKAEEEYRQLSQQTVPLRGIDQKLVRAGKDDASFIDRRLPSRYSDVVEQLGRVAEQNHIRITSIAYKTDPGPLSGMQDLEMHAGLAGSYVNVVKFMNSLERDKMFFIIDAIGLSGQNPRDGQGSGEVRLDMKLDTYLRAET